MVQEMQGESLVCPYCKEALNPDATVCRACGREHPSSRGRKSQKIWTWVAFIAGGLALLFFIAAALGPHTVGDVAADAKAECIRDKGDGTWTASSGITLDKFCEAAGDLKALEQDRKEHPENY